MPINMVIAYDIAHSRRLKRIARVMKDYGTRVQKSIFIADIDPLLFARMRYRAEQEMVLEEDAVKYFPLCDRCSDTLIAIGRDAGEYEIKPFEII
jgi:CRISPR-associated protein Cas2